MVALALTLVIATAVAVGITCVFGLLLGGFYSSLWQLPVLIGRVLWTILRTLGQYVARGFNPRFPEWTLLYEIANATLHTLTSHNGHHTTTATNAPIIRRHSECMGNLIGHFVHKANKTTLESFTFNGLEHAWVRSAATDGLLSSESPSLRVVILYIHGGGYAVFGPRLYQGFASELLMRLRRELSDRFGQNVDVDVLLANYRKAPEHPYPQPPLDAFAMYKYLLDEEKLSPRQIMVMGDSAGGGLAMTTLLRLRDEDPSLLPAAAILSCPFVNREIKGDERATPHCILSDRLIDAFNDAYYHGDETPASWGDASPHHCDLHGLPPVYIQVGELDYLLPHAKLLFRKAHDSGLSHWTLEIVPHMAHVFALLPPFVLPTAATGIDAMAQYAASQFAKSLGAIGTDACAA